MPLPEYIFIYNVKTLHSATELYYALIQWPVVSICKWLTLLVANQQQLPQAYVVC